MRVLASLVLIVAGALVSVAEARQAAKRSPGVASVVYVLEVDPVRARTVGWTAADASDAEAAAAAAVVVQRRLSAMERSVRLTTDREGLSIELTMPQVQLRDRELFAEMLESLGLCEFLGIADDTLVVGLALDLTRERAKLDAWRGSNPSLPLAAFHALGPDTGPHARLLWVETLFAADVGPPVPLLLSDRPEDHLGAVSIARAYQMNDSFGYPAIGIELTQSRVPDFERFTGAHVGHRLGVLLEGRVRCAPTLNTKLVDHAMIEGRFTEEETARLAGALRKRQGPLKVVEIR